MSTACGGADSGGRATSYEKTRVFLSVNDYDYWKMCCVHAGGVCVLFLFFYIHICVKAPWTSPRHTNTRAHTLTHTHTHTNIDTSSKIP